MKYYRIKNWEQFQHYKDRNPPWIKLHRELLTSVTWVALDDASRVLAVASMMLAAATDNKIPATPSYLQRVAYLHQIPDLTPLVEIDFIEFIDESGNLLADASKVLADARPEKRRAEKSREELSSDSPTPSRFQDFWKTYPSSSRKVAKSTCEKKWKAKKLDSIAEQILQDIQAKADSKTWRDGFAPAPLTYLNQERWNDGGQVDSANPFGDAI